jgi:hypothetical protein
MPRAFLFILGVVGAVATPVLAKLDVSWSALPVAMMTGGAAVVLVLLRTGEYRRMPGELRNLRRQGRTDEEIEAWLKSMRLDRRGETDEDFTAAAFLLALALFVLAFHLIPWRPAFRFGALVRIIAYLYASVALSALLVDMGLRRALLSEPFKAISRLMPSPAHKPREAVTGAQISTRRREASSVVTHRPPDEMPVSSAGVATLLLCSRSDNLSPESTLEEAVALFRTEGMAGSRALAALIREQEASRTRGIIWSLAAVRGAQPTEELGQCVRAVQKAEPTRHGERGRFEPEIMGNQTVGWSDGTHRLVLAEAERVLEDLVTRGGASGETQAEHLPGPSDSPQERPAERDRVPGEGTLESPAAALGPACVRCGAPAQWLFGLSPGREPVCEACRRAPGICMGCGRSFGSDASLIFTGRSKHCRACHEHYERELSAKLQHARPPGI